jgi:Ca2+:H+ antiporter
MCLPNVFSHIPDAEFDDMISLSRIIAIVMLIVYGLFLYFQLVSHAEAFEGVDAGGEEEEEEPQLHAAVAASLLFATTCCVAYCSEFLVDAIEGVSVDYGIPSSFIGLILLPIVGNAAEHATALTVAAKGKMDLALGVAVGSSTQITLFVVPFAVVVGWCYDVPMSLNFHIFETTTFLLSVFIASSVLSDGHANWFEGSMLCATYVIVAAVTWFIPNEKTPERMLGNMGSFAW